MKILYVSTISNTLNAFLIPHIRMLVELGHKVDLACKINSKLDKEFKNLGCQIHNIEFDRKPFSIMNYRAYKQIQNLVLLQKYELIHVHTPVASFVTRLACRNFENVKIFYTAHGFHFYKGSDRLSFLVYSFLEKWMARYTDCLITINREDYDAARHYRFSSRQIRLASGVGIDLKKFCPQKESIKYLLREKYGLKNNDFVLIAVGELNANKRHSFLIEAIEILRSKIPNIKMLVAGTGEMLEKYKSFIRKKRIEKHVFMLGYRNDISDLMQVSDVAVSSSLREGLPVNILEAMATGLPLVVTDCRGSRDLVKNRENGFVVGRDSLDEFVDAVYSIYCNNDLKNNFREKSIDFVCQYSLDNVLSEMKSIYNDAYGSNF